MELSAVTRPTNLTAVTLILAVVIAYRAYWTVENGAVLIPYRAYWTVGNGASESSLRSWTDGDDLLRTDLQSFTLPSVDLIDETKILDLSEENECDELCQRKIQDYRKTILKDQCLALGYGENITYKKIVTKDLLKQMGHFIVSDQYKVIYCSIPKVGCTNWKRIFLVLEGVVSPTKFIEQHETHVLAGKHLKSLSRYQVEEAISRLETFKMFVFVRNPFARLLSAYKDKVEGPTKNNFLFRRNWDRYIGLDLANKSTSFRERYDTFVRYVRYLSDNELSNPHWNDMHKISISCQMKFDFIGRMETIGRDTKFVLDNILHDDQKNVTYRHSTNPTNSNNLFNYYFSKLPQLDMIALYQRFWVDFSLFGYEIPEKIRNNSFNLEKFIIN